MLSHVTQYLQLKDKLMLDLNDFSFYCLWAVGRHHMPIKKPLGLFGQWIMFTEGCLILFGEASPSELL